MKTNNPQNYRLVKSVFVLFCEKNYLKPYNNPVFFEHDTFCCSAENDDGDTVQFVAVDAACPYCVNRGVDYCFNCGRSSEIDFEPI